MKNISTLSNILIICFFYTISYAQQNSQNQNNSFQLEVIEYSFESDSKKPRYHILSLQNNSNKELTFNLSTTVNDTNGGIEKNNSNLIVEILNEGLNEPFNFIILSPKESRRFKVKIATHPNARLGSMNVCKVIAQLPDSDDKKTVKINAYIPDPDIKGH